MISTQRMRRLHVPSLALASFGAYTCTAEKCRIPIQFGFPRHNSHPRVVPGHQSIPVEVGWSYDDGASLTRFASLREIFFVVFTLLRQRLSHSSEVQMLRKISLSEANRVKEAPWPHGQPTSWAANFNGNRPVPGNQKRVGIVPEPKTKHPEIRRVSSVACPKSR